MKVGAVLLVTLLLVGSLSGIARAGYTQPPGLVGYWNFDQGSGTIAQDGSGYNNQGTIYGASWTSGKVNGALNFNGLNNYVDCGNNEILDPVQGATIEAWVNFNQLPSVANHIMAIAGRSGNGRDLDLQTETDNRFKFYVGPGLPNVAVSNTAVETNKWYHIVGTYLANNYIKIYVNGVLEKTTLISITRNTNGDRFFIGQSCVFPGRFFNGIIDEVKIYNRALSAEEIVAEYTHSHTLPPPILSSSNEVTGEPVEATGPAGAVPANTTVQLYWDTTTGAWDGAKGLMNSTTADASGAYKAWFTVPEATFGTHQVWVKDADGNTASVAYTIQTDNENSPQSGAPGDTITGTFYGFHATKNLAAILSTANPPVSTAVFNEVLAMPDGVAAEFKGTLSHRYLDHYGILFKTNGVQQAYDDGGGNIVDSGGPLTVSGTIDYVTGAYDIIFTTPPPSLPIGLTIDYRYYGTSSAPGSTLFDLGSGVTNSVGSAVITWKVPTNVAISGNNNVFTVESGGLMNNIAFRIMGIQLSSSSGPTGETITLTGNGFSPDEDWNASIGSKTLGTGKVSAAGLLQGGSGLLIPYGLSPGVYTITVLDIDSDTETSAQFIVTYGTSITVNPDAGPNNYNVTISGKGFSYLATGPSDLTFKLYKTTTGATDSTWDMDVKQNWPVNGPITATVNSLGIVRAYWIVPGSDKLGTGTYYINATDADDYSAQATFKVLPKHVVATPRNATFARGDTITFQLEDTYKTAPVDGSVIKIYDPSGSPVFSSDKLDSAKWIKTGLWYTLPYSAQTASGNPMVIPDGAPLGIWSFKWVGTDSKDIAAGTFTVARARVETAYRSLQPTVNNEINSANYSSPDAKVLIDQAQSAYQQAATLADQGKFQDAVTDLNSASDLLSRAQTSENTYQTAYNSYQLLLQSVQTKLNQETGAGYKSTDAQSLLSQAQTYISQAANSTKRGQLQDANNKLTSASNLLDQAAAAEKSYVPNSASGGIPGFPIEVVFMGTMLAILLLALWRRNSRARTRLSFQPYPVDGSQC
jgi:cellobiose-specific phosphotransferase system component IIA